MTYNILTFREFNRHHEELNYLKHKLKSPLTTRERSGLEKQIEDKTKVVKHHLNKLHQGILGEDGMGGGAMSAGPTNVVSSGAIAGTGGKGGEPGVHLPRKKKSPVMMSIRRKSPKA